MPIVKLSESFIRNNLQCPEAKSRIEYCDSELPGLYVKYVQQVQVRAPTIYAIKTAPAKPVIKKLPDRQTSVWLKHANKPEH